MLWSLITSLSFQVDFARLKSDIQLLERNDFTLMKTENERLMTDVEKLKQRLREEITRTTAGVRLDLNLEKGMSIFLLSSPCYVPTTEMGL